MEEVSLLIYNMVCGIVDNKDGVVIHHSSDDKGHMFQVEVSPNDIGKVIGKQGRIASALRTIAKACGAKNGARVMINVLNKPRES